MKLTIGTLFAASYALSFAFAHEHREHMLRSSPLAPGPDNPQIQFAPIPQTAVGPTIDPNLGYFLEDLGFGTFWITDGLYQSMFLVSDKSVIVVECVIPA
jgi:hypothetical protein